MLSDTTWSKNQQQHRRQQSAGGNSNTSQKPHSQQQQHQQPKTTGYLQHHYQQQQQPAVESIIMNNNTNNNDTNTTHTNMTADDDTSHLDLPMLGDLLKVVGGESRTVDKHLYTLLSGIVAAVEVTNERVVELSEQYQELSLEVATVSRVVQSNQLSSMNVSNNNNNNNNNNKDETTTENHNRKEDSSIIKRIGAVQSQRPTPSSSSSTSRINKNNTNRHNNNNTSITPANASTVLATESVSALHHHAVADLENKIDNLAVRISKLQEEVGVKSKEALESTYSEVLDICDREKNITETAMHQTAKTFEGQMAVRLGELFAEGESRLNDMVQDAFSKLKECTEELTTSFSQTSKAFIDNTSAAASNTMKQATSACYSMITESRESAVLASHQATIASYETESKMLSLYKNFEKLVDRETERRTANPISASTAPFPSPPLQFRCCSAIDEIRALYNLFQIDGSEALRLFTEKMWQASGNNNNNQNISSNTYKNNNNTGFINSNMIESLSLCLRMPMLRCMEPLPSLGLQVTDSPPPTLGAEVAFIREGGRAHLCGLKVGDIIIRVDGRELGAFAASKGGLHLALMTAPSRPLPNAVGNLVVMGKSNSSTINNTKSDEHNMNSNSSSRIMTPTSASSTPTRWMPNLPRQDQSLLVLNNNNNNTNSSGSSSNGVQLTVYRYKDALTFTCRIKLD